MFGVEVTSLSPVFYADVAGGNHTGREETSALSSGGTSKRSRRKPLEVPVSV